MLEVFIHLVPEAEGFALSMGEMWAARPEQPGGISRRGSFSPSDHKSPSSSATGGTGLSAEVLPAIPPTAGGA